MVRMKMSSVLVAVLAAVVAFSAACAGSCIVSGDVMRDSAVSKAVEFGDGLWFDSSSFAIEIAPCLGDFNSYPNGTLIILR